MCVKCEIESETFRVVTSEMAQQGNQAEKVKFSCSICLDPLKDPVTIPCGHNYCLSCIRTHWNDDQKILYSCPQCRQTFTPRTTLVKNTMLAELVEELQKTVLQAPPADHCYAGPGDVTCDVCTGRKLKAFKSCLVCLVSYCEQHLQPHYESPAFKKHKLVEASNKLKETICRRHDEVMKIFCRTDEQCICYLCSMDEHKGHEILSAAAERTEKQKKVSESRQQLKRRIETREADLQKLKQDVEAINRSAGKAVEESETFFTELIHVIEQRSSDVKQQIRSQQETEIKWATKLQKTLDEEIAGLKKKDAELEQLSRTEDHTQFLRNYPSLSGVNHSTDICHVVLATNFMWYLEDMKAAITAAKDKMLTILKEKWPKELTRADFLQYSNKITLDSDTANAFLDLSDGNRKITMNTKNKPRPPHPDRFIHISQVLSKDGMTGRCYWEVEKNQNVAVAVAFKSIGRSGDFNAHVFGYNEQSWVLRCNSGYTFRHNNIAAHVSGPPSSKIGVYLDHSAGILCFYSVSESLTLLHKVKATFTKPLYAGLGLALTGDTAELCELA